MSSRSEFMGRRFSRIHRLSRLLLVVLLVCVAADWLRLWWPVLTDPGLQIDDARTHLVGYHRFDRDPKLIDDPVAGVCLAMQTWFIRIFYRIVTPATGVFVAAKWAQLLCVLMVVVAAAILTRSRRWGLPAGAFLGFASLAFPWWVGGTPRQFGPPLLGLYIAGALAGRGPVRHAAAVMAAGIYPSAAILMLGAEGLLMLRHVLREAPRQWAVRAGKLACLILVCAGLALLPRPGREALGPVVTLADAKTNPDYRDGARRLNMDLSANPFSKSIREVLFEIGFVRVNPDSGERVSAVQSVAAWLGLALLVWLMATKRVRIPAVSPAFLVSGAAAYWLACHLAFRLYLPNRYSEYGMGAGGIAFLIGVLAQTRIPMRPARVHRAISHLVAAGCLAGLWVVWGRTDRFGEIANISRAPHAALYEWAGTLPKDARFASHPYDGDDIPFWAGRASLCGYELDQPFFTKAWHNSVGRTRAAFSALYATNRPEVVAFCDEWRITHFLLRADRYREDFRKRAKYSDPFGDEIKARLRGIEREQLVLAEPPGAAVVFRDDVFVVVDGAALRRAWGIGGATNGAQRAWR